MKILNVVILFGFTLLGGFISMVIFDFNNFDSTEQKIVYCSGAIIGVLVGILGLKIFNKK